MRIILEGPIGVGKTELANELSKRTAIPVYRPFRSDPKHHLTSAEAVAMRQDVGLNINGWEEDIYVADFLSVVPTASVILDRSMPSAIAYAGQLDTRKRQTILRMWTERMIAARASLVLVWCPEPERAARAVHRNVGFWEVSGIEDAINEVIAMANGRMQILIAFSNDADPATLADHLVRRLVTDKDSAIVMPLGGIRRIETALGTLPIITDPQLKPGEMLLHSSVGDVIIKTTVE